MPVNQRPPADPTRSKMTRPQQAQTARPQVRPSAETFVYKWEQPDPDSIRQRATRTGSSRFDSPLKPGTPVWRAKGGDNYLRICPRGWPPEGKDKDYAYRVWLHKYVGQDNSTYVCPRRQWNKPCAICDAEYEIKKEGDYEAARKIAASENFFCYVIDRQESPDNPQVWMQSATQDTAIAAICSNKRTNSTVYPDQPDVGYDLTVIRTGVGMKTSYGGWQLDRDPSPLHEDPRKQKEILKYVCENPIPDLLQEYDYDYLERQMAGVAPEKDQDLDAPSPFVEEPAEETTEETADTGNGFDAENQYEAQPGEDQGADSEYAEPEEATPPPPRQAAPTQRRAASAPVTPLSSVPPRARVQRR